MAWVWKILTALIGGIITYFLGAVFWALALAQHTKSSEGIGYVLITALIAMILALTAKNGGKAVRRVAIYCALICFAMPLASFVSTIFVVADTTGTSGAEQVGKAIGTTLITGASGFFGFFLGIIAVLIAVFVRKDKPQQST